MCICALCSRDLVMAACDEAARKREARRGKIPTQSTVRGEAACHSPAHVISGYMQS